MQRSVNHPVIATFLLLACSGQNIDLQHIKPDGDAGDVLLIEWKLKGWSYNSVYFQVDYLGPEDTDWEGDAPLSPYPCEECSVSYVTDVVDEPFVQGVTYTLYGAPSEASFALGGYAQEMIQNEDGEWIYNPSTAVGMTEFPDQMPAGPVSATFRGQSLDIEHYAEASDDGSLVKNGLTITYDFDAVAIP